jgi:hypothetical protein
MGRAAEAPCFFHSSLFRRPARPAANPKMIRSGYQLRSLDETANTYALVILPKYPVYIKKMRLYDLLR